MNLLYGILILFSKYIQGVYSHAKMTEPPSRSTMWRYGFDTPINYDDNQLYCGGYRRTVLNNGKCGVCGDPYDGPYENEAGGKFATGTIVRHYSERDRFINISVDVSAHHMGYFQFKICPHNNVKERVKQSCLDQYPLKIIHRGKSQNSVYRYYPYRKGTVHMRVEIPEGLICSQCVLQWHYTTGNFWGINPDGMSCRGCGPQEQFVNCADISIGFGNADNNKNHRKLVHKNENGDHTDYHNMYSYKQIHPLPQRNNTVPLTSTSKQECNRCYALPTWRHYPKMDDWCDENCKLGNCPPCRCFCGCPNIEFVNPCSSKGDKAGPKLSEWCWRECCENDCPVDKCECTGNITDHTMSIYDVKKQFFIAGLLYTHNIDQNETITLLDKMEESPGSTPKPITKLRLYSTKVAKEHIVIPTAVSKFVKETASYEGKNSSSLQNLQKQLEYDEMKGTFSSNVEAKLLDLLKPRNHSLSQIKVYSNGHDDFNKTQNVYPSHYVEPEPEGLAILMHEADTNNTKIQYQSEELSNMTIFDTVKTTGHGDIINPVKVNYKDERKEEDVLKMVTTTEPNSKDNAQVEKTSAFEKRKHSFTTQPIPTPPVIMILPSPPSVAKTESDQMNDKRSNDSKVTNNNYQAKMEKEAKDTWNTITTTESNSRKYAEVKKTSFLKSSHNRVTTQSVPSPPPILILPTPLSVPKTNSKQTVENEKDVSNDLKAKIQFEVERNDIQNSLNANDRNNEKVHFETKNLDSNPSSIPKSTSNSLDGLSIPPPPPPPSSYYDELFGTDVRDVGSDELTITKNWNDKNLTGIPLDKTNENMEHIIDVQKIERLSPDDDDLSASFVTTTSSTPIFREDLRERRKNPTDLTSTERVKIFFDVPDQNEITSRDRRISGSTGIHLENPWFKNTVQLFNEEIKMIEENVLNFKREQDSMTKNKNKSNNERSSVSQPNELSQTTPIIDKNDPQETAKVVSSTVKPFLGNSDDIFINELDEELKIENENDRNAIENRENRNRGLADLIEEFDNSIKSSTSSTLELTEPSKPGDDSNWDIFTTTMSSKTTSVNRPTKSLTLNYLLQFSKTIDIQQEEFSDASQLTTQPTIASLFKSADENDKKSDSSHAFDENINQFSLAGLINRKLTSMQKSTESRGPNGGNIPTVTKPPLERLRDNGIQILDILSEARKIKRFQSLPDDTPENTVLLDLALMNNILELLKNFVSNMNIVVVE